MVALFTMYFVVLFAFVALSLANAGVGASESAGNGTVEETKDFRPIGAIKMEFNLARGSYPDFQRQHHQELATSRTVDGIPVLVAKTLPGMPPIPMWITVTSRSAKMTLAVCNDDNIYVAGFGNEAGWFAFARFLQIRGSMKLLLSEDYGGHRKLSTYKEGKDKVQEAALGISLARLIVVVSEAARFKGLKDHALVTGKEAKLVALWGTISGQLA